MQRAGVLVTEHALALDTPILTTDGWKTMGTVEVGDHVYAEDGQPTRVSHVSEVFEKPCYEVSFADGAKITSTGDHLWRVWDAAGNAQVRAEGRAWKTLSTEQLSEVPKGGPRGATNRYRVRCDAVPQTPAANLPIDPYVFGYWLGDGTSRSPTITVGAGDLAHLQEQLALAGYRVVSEEAKVSEWGSGWDVRFANDAKHMDGIESRLKRLGVLRNKHIPDIYLNASAEQRRALLAGLMDSDGCISSQPRAMFSNANERLAREVHRLARSLGQRATVNEPNGDDGCFTVGWTPSFDPCRIDRKSARFYRPDDVRGRRLDLMSVTDIRPVPMVPTRCIAVEHESHVFLAGETFVPTHNTLLQLDVVFTSLRLITTAILRTGNLRAYEEKLSDENIPYRRYLKKQPSLLTSTFLGANGKVYQYDGRRKTLMSMLLFGEAFWYILMRSKPEAYASAIEVLHPAFMEVKVASPQDVAARRASNVGESMYIYGAANDKKLLDPGDVVHIPFMSMPQSRRGLSTVQYAGISAALALAAYEFGSTWFSQGASPSFLLTTDQKLGVAEVERIADKFIIQHGGLANAHRPLVLDSGIKPEKVMTSPDEAQYLNTLEYSRNVVAAWFGTDELIPNALQRQTPSPAHTAQERMQRFVTLTLSGLTVPLEEVHSSLLPGDQLAGVEEHKLLTPDPQFLSQEIEALRGSQVGTINNLRVRKLGWEPLDDPAADEAIQPLASNTAPSQTGAKPEDDGKASEPDEDDDGDEPKGK